MHTVSIRKKSTTLMNRRQRLFFFFFVELSYPSLSRICSTCITTSRLTKDASAWPPVAGRLKLKKMGPPRSPSQSDNTAYSPPPEVGHVIKAQFQLLPTFEASYRASRTTTTTTDELSLQSTLASNTTRTHRPRCLSLPSSTSGPG